MTQSSKVCGLGYDGYGCPRSSPFNVKPHSISYVCPPYDTSVKLYVGHKDAVAAGTAAVLVAGVKVGVKLVELVLLGELELS